MASSAWTPEQIVALAPDAGSVKAGRELATARKWVSLGRNEQAVWGECQGSGAKPYQTKIDLSEPAFQCSCPSRKFPCKHALGLFLLLAGQPAAFTETEPPGWVSEWLAARAQRVEQRAKKESSRRVLAASVDSGASGEMEGDTPVVDAVAQARRTADREARVAAGLEELDLWLRDLVRRGLAHAHGQPFSFWETPAARMVDAQAPGVARLLREMAGIPASGAGWQERLLERLGRLYLLIEGFKRLETLPPETQADIRSRIGWTKSQEELQSEPGLRDDWLVLGQRVDEEERLRVQRTWLRGRNSKRAALILQFAHGSQPLDVSLLPGTAIDADLVFYPGAYPLRAVIKTQHAAPAPLDGMPCYAGAAGALAAYAAALARDPWLESFPLGLAAVVPVASGDGWAVRDEAGQMLSLAPHATPGWRLMALSGGHPLSLFGEWNGVHLRPLAVCMGGRYCPVTPGPL